MNISMPSRKLRSARRGKEPQRNLNKVTTNHARKGETVMQTVEMPKAESIQTVNIVKERQIAAPIELVFETVIQPHGRQAEMSLKLEKWPGGRWYRDLGNNT